MSESDAVAPFPVLTKIATFPQQCWRCLRLINAGVEIAQAATDTWGHPIWTHVHCARLVAGRDEPITVDNGWRYVNDPQGCYLCDKQLQGWVGYYLPHRIYDFANLVCQQCYMAETAPQRKTWKK